MNPQLTSSLLKKFNLTTVDLDKKEEFLTIFYELISQQTINTILENSPKDKLDLFLRFLQEDETGEKAYRFAQANIPNFEAKLANDMELLTQKLSTSY